ncbi:acylphosphatase [Patescibacteria group bacterium]|nr:acylphosphatase [Patescibacteria group bacterium]
MLQAHVFISGSVHGVGYRFFVKSWAKTYGIVGWVKNLQEEKVEAVFQGDEKNIEDLIAKCRKGPFLAEIKDIVVNWEEVAGEFGDFQVVA